MFSGLLILTPQKTPWHQAYVRPVYSQSGVTGGFIGDRDDQRKHQTGWDVLKISTCLEDQTWHNISEWFHSAVRLNQGWGLSSSNLAKKCFSSSASEPLLVTCFSNFFVIRQVCSHDILFHVFLLLRCSSVDINSTYIHIWSIEIIINMYKHAHTQNRHRDIHTMYTTILTYTYNLESQKSKLNICWWFLYS